MAIAKGKKQRFGLRTTFEQKATIEQAALLKQKSATSFILDAAYEAAQSLICDQANIILCATDLKQFCHALDHPPASNAALKKLMNRKSKVELSEKDNW